MTFLFCNTLLENLEFCPKIQFLEKLALTPPSAAGARPAELSSLRSLFCVGSDRLFGQTIEC